VVETRTDLIPPLRGDASSRAAGAVSADFLDRAAKVADLVEREADETERAGTMTRPVFDALVDSGLFWILLPSDLGGGGQGVVPFLEVVEELSRADASSGWSYMANAGSIGVAAGFLQPEATREMFGGPSKAITAGQLGPIGRGTEVTGGYRFTGDYQFGSGSAHASWIGGGFLVEEAGRIRVGADGTPDARIAFLPRERATFLGNWDVTGLVGTGSHDYRISDQIVPKEFTYARSGAVPVRGEPVFALGHLGLGIAGHAAVALGLMKSALGEVARITDGKKRVGYPGPVGDYPLFLHGLAKHDAMYRSARGYVLDVFGEAEAKAATGRTVTSVEQARIRQVSTWVHDVASEVVGFCRLWGGTQAFRNPTRLGRVIRDLAVATQHVLVDPVTLVAAGSVIAGTWR
jgi:alkylation response protein AidB-like acyl-CoA dehydrogenase